MNITSCFSLVETAKLPLTAIGGGISRWLNSSVFFLISDSESMPETANYWSSTMNMVARFFSITITFIFVVFLAVVILRITSRYRNFGGATRNLRLMESTPLGSGSFLHLVKAGDKYIVIGTGKENLVMITELSPEVVNDVAHSTGEGTFEGKLREQLSRVLQRDFPIGKKNEDGE